MERDFVQEAMDLIDKFSELRPEQVHLVALRQHYGSIIRRQEVRIHELLRKLDAEHVHDYAGKVGECETCVWLKSQQEWQDYWEEQRLHDEQYEL
jgi:hypothetical protein